MSPVPCSGTIGQSASWRLLCVWCYYPCSLGFFRAPATLRACCCAFIVVAPDLLLCVDFSVVLWLQLTLTHSATMWQNAAWFPLLWEKLMQFIMLVFVFKFESLEEVFFYFFIYLSLLVILLFWERRSPMLSNVMLQDWDVILAFYSKALGAH